MIEATELELIDCQLASPYRPVAWRWWRARGIRLGLLPDPGRRSDPWVTRALRLQREQAEGRYEALRPGAIVPDPAAFGAFRVWSSADPRPRRELEARVLAGQSPDEIGARLGLVAETIVSYERIFFDLRDRLGAPDYIVGVVIGLALHDGLAPFDRDAFLRLGAYSGGSHLLDALIDVLGLGDSGGVVTKSVATAERLLARSIRMAILARSIPVTERTAPGLIRLHARLLEVEREAAADVAIAGPVRTTIDPFLAYRPHGQDGPSTPPVPATADGASIGPDSDRASQAGRVGAIVSSAGADPARPGRSARRTA